MKKFISLLLIITFILTGCTGYTHYPVLVNDVEIKTVPQSVITFDNYTFCNMSSLGFSDKIVGDISSFGTTLCPNTQVLVSLNADILISSTELTKSCKDALINSGTLVIVIPPVDTLSEIINNYVTYYRIMLGNDYAEEAKSIISKYVYDELEYINNGVTKENRVSFIIKKPNFVATSDTYISEILTKCGLDNVSNGTKWNSSSNENPDIIICDSNYLLSELRKSNFSKSNAIKNNQIAFIDAEPFECQSIDMFELLRESIESVFDSSDFPDIVPSLSLSYTEPDPPTLFESIGQFLNNLSA